MGLNFKLFEGLTSDETKTSEGCIVHKVAQVLAVTGLARSAHHPRAVVILTPVEERFSPYNEIVKLSRQSNWTQAAAEYRC